MEKITIHRVDRICSYLLFLLRMIATVSINVLTNHHIRDLSLFYWKWLVTKWAYWDPNVLKTMI